MSGSQTEITMDPINLNTGFPSKRLCNLEFGPRRMLLRRALRKGSTLDAASKLGSNMFKL